MMTRSLLSVTILCLFTASTSFAADGWGSVTGKIMWKGDVPAPELLHAKGAPVKDAADCAAVDAYKQDLFVDEETKGIANVFIYLRKAPKNVHPDAKEFEPQVVFDQKYCTFIPHTLLVRAGQAVEVLNSDAASHNTHTFPLRNKGENLAIPGNTVKGKGTLFKTKSAESLPIEVKCDFHSWMNAYWLILDHPYAAISQKDGSFEIKNLPEGTHKFRVWHERVGYLERDLTVKIKDGETTELKPLEYTIEAKD